ncbi:DUF2771 family protein [Amycolatopsis nigrescens]|uniref:DUF2771 family protein n=1 Tax=Amycolatopsis nigrescens TaxID=381445 RepID=UPI00037269C1|nr:DUF2771 family protein [Amycolatopsis nigrescens]
MRLRLPLLFAAAALVLAGCSTPGPPQVTFFADGNTVEAAPMIHCDAKVQKCEQNDGAKAQLKVRAGQPVQISVPSEVAETPWVVNVQYTNAKGELQPVKQETFTNGKQFAYTASANGSDGQLVVVEVQQLGAAYAADESGQPALDEDGQPQLVARAVWSLQVQPA